MPAYTNTTNVEALLPDTLPSSVTTGDKARWISDASTMVDGLVGPRFPMLGTGQKFADITASPATPAWIELCARWLGAYFGFLQLREINKGKGPSQAGGYFRLADDHLKRIRGGEIDIYDSAGADLASATDLWSSTEDRDPTFNRGVYEDGVLVGDEGTLDDFGLE